MLLTIDIGNTEITLGLWRGEALEARWRLTTVAERTSDEWANMIGACLARGPQDRIRSAVLASVVPHVTRGVAKGTEKVIGVKVVPIDARSDLPVVLDVETPHLVGADRILNAIVAAVELRTDVVIVDLGTATTFDCVTADGRFIGGAIMPGVRTASDQLIRKAAQLSPIELRAPGPVMGRNTEECILAGVLYGAADAIDGMLRRIRLEWPGGGRPKAIATGGLSSLIGPLCTELDGTDPAITLRGLRLAAVHLGLH